MTRGPERRRLLVAEALPAAAAAGVLDALEGGLAAVLGDDPVVVVVGHRGDRGDRPQQVARFEALAEQRVREEDVVADQGEGAAGQLVIELQQAEQQVLGQLHLLDAVGHDDDDGLFPAVRLYRDLEHRGAVADVEVVVVGIVVRLFEELAQVLLQAVEGLLVDLVLELHGCPPGAYSSALRRKTFHPSAPRVTQGPCRPWGGRDRDLRVWVVGLTHYPRLTPSALGTNVLIDLRASRKSPAFLEGSLPATAGALPAGRRRQLIRSLGGSKGCEGEEH